MAAVPPGLDTDRGPTTTIPLAHFVVGIGFLLAGVTLGAGVVLGVAPGWARLAHVHLLLVGWVCVTIMGAMVQFVPVWSGTELHSRRLAWAQLALVAGGLVGFAAALLTGATGVLVPFAAAMVLGFWTFVYTVGRTLATVRPFDVTERHFALALGALVAVTSLGGLLAIDLSWRLFPALGATRTDVVAAHATLGVFGVVLTTVFGALYQLATMFTQTEIHGRSRWLRRFEELAYPLGVVGLAVGRGLSIPVLVDAGGLLVALSVLAVGIVLGTCLLETTVGRSPMLDRYAVAAASMVGYAVLATPAWATGGVPRSSPLGPPGSVHLLLAGVVGFVVLGTLYHIVPFLIWLDQYSDLLGLGDVPGIDDLYDHRLATADLAGTVGGTTLLVGGELLGSPAAVAAGGSLYWVGVGLFAANVSATILRHAPNPRSARGDPSEST